MSTPVKRADPRSGLLWLNGDEARVLRMLDDTFRGWGIHCGAAEMVAPALLPVEDLVALDCYRNFPHLAMVAATLHVGGAEDVAAVNSTAEQGRIRAERVDEPELGLPTAACWAVYLANQGRSVAADTLVTLVGRCFRAEERYEGLRRMLGFQMREIVALGGQRHCRDHLAKFRAVIPTFAAALGLEMRVDTATDPFFDSGNSRGLLAQLAPVKHEFLVGDLAIASVNTHRTFFGERCGITVDGDGGNGDTAFTSCVAFGLERWIAALADRHDSDWDVIGDKVETAQRIAEGVLAGQARQGEADSVAGTVS